MSARFRHHLTARHSLRHSTHPACLLLGILLQYLAPLDMIDAGRSRSPVSPSAGSNLAIDNPQAAGLRRPMKRPASFSAVLLCLLLPLHAEAEALNSHYRWVAGV